MFSEVPVNIREDTLTLYLQYPLDFSQDLDNYNLWLS